MPVSPRIKGLSEIRRLPRLGKIRLGIKLKSQRTGQEYPKEVAYFVCPDEVKQVYGEKPTKLDVMFPLEDVGKCFPQNYKAYVFQGLRCKGDGEVAMRRVADLVWKDKAGQVLDDATKDDFEGYPRRVIGKPDMSDPNSLVEIACPCNLLETGDCRQAANLMVILPKVSLGGVYQIDTGSYHNIVRINSAIDYVRAWTAPRPDVPGPIAFVPLILYRQEEEIQYEGKKARHYLLQMVPNINSDEANQLRANSSRILDKVSRLSLPAPVEDRIDTAPGAVVVEGEVEEEPQQPAQATPAQPATAEAATPSPSSDTVLGGWELRFTGALGKAKTLLELEQAWQQEQLTFQAQIPLVQERIRRMYEERKQALTWPPPGEQAGPEAPAQPSSLVPPEPEPAKPTDLERTMLEKMGKAESVPALQELWRANKGAISKAADSVRGRILEAFTKRKEVLMRQVPQPPPAA